MCGISGILSRSEESRDRFAKKAVGRMDHRGPDANGIWTDKEYVALTHNRLSIIDLSEAGSQPMHSADGRYVMVFNGEIYNHLQLREIYLKGHNFRGHSDSETILELFAIKGANMLQEMVGMWAILIWDTIDKTLFISRDRYGQKPLYIRHRDDGDLTFASEMKALVREGEKLEWEPTALMEYMALGNYGHLGTTTFYKEIKHFPQGHFALLREDSTTIEPKSYWALPQMKDKRPFDEVMQKELHDVVVEAVLSQTLADVPIGITLSGGIDSSIIAGILAKYYEGKVHIFTAQTPGDKYDESKYVDAVLANIPDHKYQLHKRDLNTYLDLAKAEHFLKVQEEPFGDPSIVAHGSLMQMAADAGIKVILNGQGADELFFGYGNMTTCVMAAQVKKLHLRKVFQNFDAMNLSKADRLRVLLAAFNPRLEKKMRQKSRLKRREVFPETLRSQTNDRLIYLANYGSPTQVWIESMYHVHLPHLLHYDDRNAMSVSIEGRSPFMDHRIAETIAKIDVSDLLIDGRRKHPLRVACKAYLPDLVDNRRDKIGFYTPLDRFLHNEIDNIATILSETRGDFLPSTLDQDIELYKNGGKNTISGQRLWRVLNVALLDKTNSLI